MQKLISVLGRDRVVYFSLYTVFHQCLNKNVESTRTITGGFFSQIGTAVSV